MGPIYMVVTTIAPFLFNLAIFIGISILACYFLGVRPDFIVTQAGMRIALTRRGRPVEGLGSGIVLRASPRISSGPFMNSRVLLAKYSVDQGSLGFILNRVTNINGTRINIGGPVDSNIVRTLHNSPSLNSYQIAPGLYVGGDPVQTQDLRFIRLHGYAGWYPLQLDGEVRAGDWTIEGPVNPEEVLAI
mmetsp:Transcript_22803/g.41001  ORF Transcript_22803/g.41001 Transcript_22803/m.41001 type:complete len:189 (+) Transcript_22803:276-842(+)